MSTVVVSGEHLHGIAIEVCDSPTAVGDPHRSIGSYAGTAPSALPTPDPRREHESKQVGLSETSLRKMAYQMCKRVIDIAGSLTLILLLSWLFTGVAIWIWLADRGKIFFTQDRVGKDGRIFKCYKFRSMVENAEQQQAKLQSQSRHTDPRTFKIDNDPRITGPGKWLRRLSIDELPQLFNVLKGDMSIVGPRPSLPKEVELYTPSDRRRLAVKPGLTCIWQVSGRSRIPFPQQVQMDVNYIERQSLWLDVCLIVKTIPAVLSGDGAV